MKRQRPFAGPRWRPYPRPANLALVATAAGALCELLRPFSFQKPPSPFDEASSPRIWVIASSLLAGGSCRSAIGVCSTDCWISIVAVSCRLPKTSSNSQHYHKVAVLERALVCEATKTFAWPSLPHPCSFAGHVAEAKDCSYKLRRSESQGRLPPLKYGWSPGQV